MRPLTLAGSPALPSFCDSLQVLRHADWTVRQDVDSPFTPCLCHPSWTGCLHTRRFGTLTVCRRLFWTRLGDLIPLAIQSTNLIELGLLRYANNRLSGVQESHPRSNMLPLLRRCIEVELGMILLSARTERLSVQRHDGKCSFLMWTINRFLLDHHPAMSLEKVLVKTHLILLQDFLVLLLGLICLRT